MLILSLLLLILVATSSSLFTHKSTKGAVTFNINSPTIALDDKIELNYNGEVGQIGTMTYTNDAGLSTQIEDLTLNLSVPQDNLLDEYYIKIIYDFSTIDVGNITFNNSDYVLPYGLMKTMQPTDTTNEFYSMSCNTAGEIAPFSKYEIDLNIFNFMKDFQFAYTETLNASYEFNIIVIVDSKNTCDSVNRSQTILGGILNLNIYQSTTNLTFDGATSLTINNFSQFGQYMSSTANEDINLIVSGSNVYLKFIFTTSALYGIGEVTKDYSVSGINWNSQVVTDANNTILTITSKQIINALSTSVTIDFDALLTNANYPYNSKETQNNNERAEFKIQDSSDGVDYHDVSYDNFEVYFNLTWALCCVTGDTLISIDFNGNTKRADEITIGDTILSYNLQTGKIETDKVVDVVVRTRALIYNVKLVDGTILKITGDHPIYTDRGWIACDNSTCGYEGMEYIKDKEDLKVGDKVLTANGYVEVAEIDKVQYEEGITVYTFEIEKNHNFFVNNILVHNPTPCPF